MSRFFTRVLRPTANCRADDDRFSRECAIPIDSPRRLAWKVTEVEMWRREVRKNDGNEGEQHEHYAAKYCHSTENIVSEACAVMNA